ncbi:MAG: hypothetical protein Q4F07_03190 [Bacteroidales bacterium]|nr:hypothetical protein [Bacteroidales bacterium]
MKKLATLFVIISTFLNLYSREYYPMEILGFAGQHEFFNDGSRKIEITSDYLIDENDNVTAKFRYIDENGRRVYDHTSQYEFRTEYRVSSDEKKLVKISYTRNTKFCCAIHYTDDEGERDRYYAENHHLSSGGYSMNQFNNWISDSGSSDNSGHSSGHSSSHRSSADCPYCRGTGVNLSPASGGGAASHVAYYNSAGVKCPYCNSTTKHYHYKCLH